jgi:hypothetical protein
MNKKTTAVKVRHFALTNGTELCTYHVLNNTLVAMEADETLTWLLPQEARKDYQKKLANGWNYTLQ